MLLGKGTEFFWKKSKYKIQTITEKTILYRSMEHDATDEMTMDSFKVEWSNGHIQLKNLAMNDDGEYTRKPVYNFTQKEMDQVQERLSWIKPLLSLPRGKLGKRVDIRVQELQATGIKIARSRLYEMRKDYLDSDGDMSVLLLETGKRGGKGGVRVQERVHNIITNMLEKYVLSQENKSITFTYKLIVNDINTENRTLPKNQKLTVPGLTTVYRIYNSIDITIRAKAQNSFLEYYTKHGNVGVLERPERPLQVVQMDHTPIDVLFLDDETGQPYATRAWLTTVIDVATRVPHGVNISFKPPSYESIMLTLLNAILPKNIREKYPDIKHDYPVWGLPEKIVTDNGKEFRSKHFIDACKKLGIELEHNEGRQPWGKPMIERFFGTANTGLFHQIYGTTWSNIQEKKKKDLNPVQQAAVGFQAFQMYFFKWLVDVYGMEYHRGLKDIPWEAWDKLSYLHDVKIPPSAKELRIILCPQVERTIRRDGIAWENMAYRSGALGTLLNDLTTQRLSDQVTVKYDPTDISIIYVHDVIRETFIEVMCTDMKYAKGLSLDLHRMIQKRNNGKKRKNRDEVAEAVAFLNDRFEQDKEKKKLSRSEARTRTKGSNASKTDMERVQEKAAKSAKPATINDIQRARRNKYQHKISIEVEL